ncbi:MAG: transglycosylase domain-containing protein [Actinomycetota bacterium]
MPGVRERGAEVAATMDRWWRVTRPALARWLQDVPPATRQARNHAGRHPTVRALAELDARTASEAVARWWERTRPTLAGWVHDLPRPVLPRPTLPRPTLPRPTLPRRALARWQRIVAVPLLGGIALGISGALLIPGTATLLEGGDTDDVSVADRLSVLPQRSVVYAADGSELEKLGTQNRAVVSTLDQVPPVLIDAVVAIEDRTFWENAGIDLRAAGRAFIENLDSGGVEQGGSTITQQLVKNRILSPKREIGRKLREANLAYQLNLEMTKEEILLAYLNTVYFGEGAYGVQSAAERIVGKPLDQLNAADAALLAGLISKPAETNPYDNPEVALERRDEVLDAMVEEKYLSRAEADLSGAAPLVPAIYRPPAELRPDNYFVEEVQRRLLADERLGATPEEREAKVLQGGLRIHTTLDPQLQQLAQSAVDSILPPSEFTAALVAMDPATGQVRAIVGGPNFEMAKYNLATQGARQPGSTFKVVTLATALETGYSPEDRVDGTGGCVFKIPGSADWTPGGSGGGTMTLRAATEDSINCAYARLMLGLGPQKVVDVAHLMGVQREIPVVPSITLGTAEASPLEMASIVATIAADGVHHPPIFVTKVEAPDGTVLLEEQPAGTQAIKQETARTMIDVMKGVLDRGTGTAAKLDRPAFGKTGSTDDNADAWFVGGTPQLVASVWMGSPVARVPMTNVGGIQVMGGTYPARIWKQFMASALTGVAPTDFAAPNAGLWPSPMAAGEMGRVALPPPPPPPPFPLPPELVPPPLQDRGRDRGGHGGGD